MTCQPARAQDDGDGFGAHVPGLTVVLGLALSIRVLWVSFVQADPTDGRFDDTAFYRGSAHYLAHGAGYLNPFSGTPTALWPPGYPVFLAGVFKVFGEGVAQTSAANVVLSVATIAIVYCIGLRLFDRATALVASAGLAIWPGQVYFTSLALSEPLFTCLFTLAVLLLLVVPQAPRWRWLLLGALGLTTGFALLTRAQALVLILLPLAVWLLAGIGWRTVSAWAAVAIVIAGLVMAPWAIRNERALGAFVMATSVGPNLLLGHHKDATGRGAVTEPPPLPPQGGLTIPQYEVEANNDALRIALRYAKDHPAEELPLSGAKIRATYESDATALDWIWGFEGTPRSQTHVEFLRALANGFWFVALIFAGVGLLASRSRFKGMAAVLPLTLVLWTLAHIVFFGDPRFHYPIVFVFALLAAHGLCVVPAWAAGRLHKPVSALSPL